MNRNSRREKNMDLKKRSGAAKRMGSEISDRQLLISVSMGLNVLWLSASIRTRRVTSPEGDGSPGTNPKAFCQCQTSFRVNKIICLGQNARFE